MSFFDSKAGRYFKRVGAGSLFISVAVHVVLIILAITYAITVVREERKVAFRGDGTHNGGPRSPEHRVTMARQQTSLAMATKRLSVDSPSANVSLPDLPDMPSISGGSMGMAGSFGGGGTGGGGPAGGGAGNSMKAPPMPAFGFRQPQKNGTLVGSLYDFKQSSKGTRVNVDLKKELRAYFDAGQNITSLESRFFKAPVDLYATQIYMPRMKADEAPAAFGVEKVVDPKNWVAVYRGRISPPRSGTYSFLGAADDLIIVRLDGKVVLNGGQSVVKVEGESVNGVPAGKYGVQVTKETDDGAFLWNLLAGSAVTLEASRYYDIEIYVSEVPGGFFGAGLFVEEKGVKYPLDDQGRRRVPLFRLANSETKSGGRFMIDVDTTAPVWRAQPLPAVKTRG